MIEIERKEWFFVFLIWLILNFLIFLPFFVGKIAQQKGSIFLGFQRINRSDTPYYYSLIEQAKNGHFLFKYNSTPEPHPYFIFDPFWLSVGILAKTLNLSSTYAFQLAKFLVIPIFLISSYFLLSFFFEEKEKRKWGFLILVFASGWGWFFLYLLSLIPGMSVNGVIDLRKFVDQKGVFHFPIDLWVPEAFSFLSLYNSPHFGFSASLIFLIFFLSLLFFESKKLRYSIVAGIFCTLLFQFHPYYIPTIFVTLGIFILISSLTKRKLNFSYLFHYFFLLFFSFPPIFYHLYCVFKIPVRASHFSKNILITPPLPYLLIGYGPLIFLGIYGLSLLLKNKEKREKDLFLISWFFAEIFLIYCPLIPFQRKLTEGFQMDLAILTTFALFRIKDWLIKKSIPIRFTLLEKILLVFLISVSNFTIVGNDIVSYLEKNEMFYLKKEVEEGMEWIKKNTPEDSVILSSPITGNLLLAFIDRPVYLAHPHITVNFEEKKEKVEKFFRGGEEKFLREEGIDYIFVTAKEREEIGFNLEEKNYLEKVFEKGEVEIFKVKM
jgi:hypothetical protein